VASICTTSINISKPHHHHRMTNLSFQSSSCAPQHAILSQMTKVRPLAKTQQNKTGFSPVPSSTQSLLTKIETGYLFSARQKDTRSPAASYYSYPHDAFYQILASFLSLLAQ